MTNHPSRRTRLDDAIEIANALAHPPNASVTLVEGDPGHNAEIVTRYQAAVRALDTASTLYAARGGDLGAAAWLPLSERRDALRTTLHALHARAGSPEYA